MNRRQRKKRFKKIYGMNPYQYENWLKDHWKEIMVAAIASTSEIIKTGFNQLGKEVEEAVQTIRNGIDEITEEIREAARYIAACDLQKGENDDGENGIDP